MEDKLISPTDIPTDFAPGGPLDPTQYSGPNDFVAGQYAQWFREPIAPERVTEPEFHAQLGERMMQLPAFRNLLVILKGRTLSMDEVAQRLTQNNPITRNAASDGKQRILESLLALTSVARYPEASRSSPLVDIRLEVWIREMRRMVASVEQKVQMTWANDVKDQDEEDATSHLPMVLCRNCGTAAWGGTRRQNDHNIRRNLTAFYAAFFNNQPDLCLIFPGEQEEWEDRRDGKVYFLCAHCLTLHRKHQDCPCNNTGDLICVFIPDLISTTNGRSKASPKCPNCDSHYGISIVGAQASVRQANWQGYSGWKSRNMKQEPSTYFREPCAVTREGGREVSVAAQMARDIEQRKMCRSGRRDYRCGRRQYVRHRYGERADRPAVSKTPWTYVHILPGPGRSFQRPAPRAGPPKRRRNADRRMYVEEKSDAMIVVMKLANKAWKTMWRSWWSEASHPRGNRSSRHALDTEPGSCAKGRCGYGNGPVRWSVNVMRGGATQGKSRMR